MRAFNHKLKVLVAAVILSVFGSCDDSDHPQRSVIQYSDEDHVNNSMGEEEDGEDVDHPLDSDSEQIEVAQDTETLALDTETLALDTDSETESGQFPDTEGNLNRESNCVYEVAGIT